MSLQTKSKDRIKKLKTELKNHQLSFCFHLSFYEVEGSYIISVAKTASKKIGALICSMKSLSSEVALYLNKAMYGILLPCLGWCS